MHDIKNTIPAKAIAKFDIRLVANQDPDHVFSCIENHIKIKISRERARI